MSSLFDHNQDSVLNSFNKVYKVKNKNKEGHRNIFLNVRSLKSPDTRSNSLRKKSAAKLFKEAHNVPSQTTQQTFFGQKSDNDFGVMKSAENQKLASTIKTRRTHTFEDKKNKITLKKKLSEGNSIQRTVQICVNGEAVCDTEEKDLVNSLTRLILDEENQGDVGGKVNFEQMLGQSTIIQNSFELQIDSNLVQGNPQLLEWSQLIKRI